MNSPDLHHAGSPQPDLVSSSEAAEILGCSSDNVRRLVREGQLRPAVSTRAGRLLHRADVIERARRQSTEPRRGGGR
jgi:excisionase family DNA binding protein